MTRWKSPMILNVPERRMRWDIQSKRTRRWKTTKDRHRQIRHKLQVQIDLRILSLTLFLKRHLQPKSKSLLHCCFTLYHHRIHRPSSSYRPWYKALRCHNKGIFVEILVFHCCFLGCISLASYLIIRTITISISKLTSLCQYLPQVLGSFFK